MQIIKLLLLALFTLSCQSKDNVASTPQVKEVAYFSPTEVVATLNALVAIIDWPEDTVSYQKNLSVNLESARKLMLPLHPLWDEKIAEVAAEMHTWDKAKIQGIIDNCQKKCECDFYQEAHDKNAVLMEDSNPELKKLADLRFQKTKESSLQCLQNMGSIQNLLKYLKAEQKNYEAPST